MRSSYYEWRMTLGGPKAPQACRVCLQQGCSGRIGDVGQRLRVVDRVIVDCWHGLWIGEIQREGNIEDRVVGIAGLICSSVVNDDNKIGTASAAMVKCTMFWEALGRVE